MLEDATPQSEGPDGPPIALLLPGQGAQYPGMVRGLYDWDHAFTDTMDRFFGLLGRPGAVLRDGWLAARPGIGETMRAQPLLFALDCALADMLRARGLRPAAVLGHSAGEYAAAVVAGVVGFDDAAGVVLERLSLMEQAPPGGMCAVAADPEQAEPLLEPAAGVVVGAVNGPRQILVCGPQGPLDAAVARLSRAGFGCRPVDARHGFHSPSVEPACRAAIDLFAGMRPVAPRILFVSGYTGAVLTASLARDPAFWAMQPSRPVLFGAALGTLLAQCPYPLVEAGPGQSLSALARRHPAAGRSRAVVSMSGRRPGPPEADRAAAGRALEQLAAVYPGQVSQGTERRAGAESTGRREGPERMVGSAA